MAFSSIGYTEFSASVGQRYLVILKYYVFLQIVDDSMEKHLDRDRALVHFIETLVHFWFEFLRQQFAVTALFEIQHLFRVWKR